MLPFKTVSSHQRRYYKVIYNLKHTWYTREYFGEIENCDASLFTEVK